MTQAILTRRPPSTVSSAAAAIAAGCRGTYTPRQRASVAELLLRRALRAGLWLPAELVATEPGRYRSRTVHVDRESGITIRVLAWRRGQHTPIHGHIAWCVIGVYAGSERELRYTTSGAGGDTRLHPSGDHVMHAGQTAVLLPPDDVHEVTCLTDDAVSIHIYGSALEPDEPSMRMEYDRSAVL